MFIYNLNVAMANKQFSFEENPEMIDLIKQAIVISNSSVSAARNKRTIEFQRLIDKKHFLLTMKSRVDINPTRSLSSLTRALLALEKEDGTSVLNACTANGCVFDAKVVDILKQSVSENALSDSLLLKSVIDLIYSEDEDCKHKLKQVILEYINKE